ncbi:hypothetical protein [Cellulosimicrobium sp. JZ28]|uniref:hypothetical protein n=1 Tax=Cellulosimicrobium sp. JZ28 TaxID=1906273 RepID=UPI001E6092D6|nr:hypothetical protein [Cellulosimicrobium sp. JZ28]
MPRARRAARAGAGHLRAALPAAAGMAVHTAGVTYLSRGEVHGTTSSLAAGVAAATAAGGAVVGAGAVRRARAADGGANGRARVATAVTGVAAAGAYLATCLPRQVDAAITPSAQNAFAATKAGIRAMLPLQAAWSARGGAWRRWGCSRASRSRAGCCAARGGPRAAPR